ncbi:MAG: HAD family hydrolase [Clostridiales bacterium]|nr:HAD family hydrolase [Clostridiales bacterium]
MFKAVFCDFYGTLVFEDDEPMHAIAEQIYKTGKAGSLNEISSFWGRRFSALCLESYGGRFRTQRKLELQSLWETLEYFSSTEDAKSLSQPQFTYWTEPPVFDDTKMFFAKCPLPICIVSNIDTADVKNALNFHNLKPAEIVTSEEARSYKPRPEIFEFATKKLGCSPGEVLHIGDSITNDIKGAEAAGIRAIWINRKNKPIPPKVKLQANGLLEALNILKELTLS